MCIQDQYLDKKAKNDPLQDDCKQTQPVLYSLGFPYLSVLIRGLKFKFQLSLRFLNSNNQL